jgi:hypothetical protein
MLQRDRAIRDAYRDADRNVGLHAEQSTRRKQARLCLREFDGGSPRSPRNAESEEAVRAQESVVSFKKPLLAPGPRAPSRARAVPRSTSHRGALHSAKGVSHRFDSAKPLQLASQGSVLAIRLGTPETPGDADETDRLRPIPPTPSKIIHSRNDETDFAPSDLGRPIGFIAGFHV